VSLYPKIHAFYRGLFEANPAKEARAAFNDYERALHDAGGSDAIRNELIALIDSASAGELSGYFGRRLPLLIDALLKGDNLFELPEFDWSSKQPIAAYWDAAEKCRLGREHVALWQEHPEIIAQPLHGMLTIFMRELPRADRRQDALRIPSSIIHLIGELPRVVEMVCGAFLHEDFDKAGLFKNLRERLASNLIVASGGSPNDPDFKKQPVWPTASKIEDREELVMAYLRGTPLLQLFQGDVDFALPLGTRYEHHHIVAGSGHGKTQTLQFLIAKDLDAVAAGKRSVVVIDSQGDLIRTISQLEVFAPGQPLHERLVMIDPTDVEFPVSLNLFDVGQSRLQGYSQLERERLTNSIIELFDFVLGSLLSAEMTQKQNVIFRYVTRLMLQIPDATIQTLRELMEPKSEVRFAPYIAKLTGSARHFFETEFGGSEFTQTRKQVLRRLWGILENQTFERMFSHPRSKLDLYEEMNAGKVILINTAKDLLKDGGTEIFGRFFIALIVQAAQERAVLREHERLPTFVYIDEAADYFDKNFATMLSQARKQKVGMILAHQYLGQLEPRLLDAFAANTAIKFAGGVSAKDSRQLAQMLSTTPEFIESQRKGSFAAYVRGETSSAVPLTIPFGFMEKLPRMSTSEARQVRNRMRERYAAPIGEVAEPTASAPPPPHVDDEGFATDW
jgi:hypothetical protein